MIKYWQSMQDYKYFLTESKVHFDSSERNRLHTELWKTWQKLRLFHTDKAMEFLLPFYSPTGRPAKNQPQILRSFILLFFLYSEGLAKPSLTLWVERLMAGKDIPFNFEQRLQQFFYHVAVLPSTECGLIPEKHLTVSGDGTAVHTHAFPNGHHRDGAPDSLCHFSDPDAAWGWDSDLDQYYFGYTLFQLSCHNPELKTDIPLLLRFTSARRHDSVSFLISFHELEKHMPAVSIENMCLDSDMDNYPTCRILRKKEIRAFIDPNDKCGRPKTIPDTITIDKDGTPLCQEKLRMKPNGYDKSSGYLMW